MPLRLDVSLRGKRLPPLEFAKVPSTPTAVKKLCAEVLATTNKARDALP